MISNNPTLGLEMLIVHFRLVVLLKTDFYEKRMDMLAYTPSEFNFLETPVKVFNITVIQNQFIQKSIFNNPSVLRIAIAMITNSVFHWIIH